MVAGTRILIAEDEPIHRRLLETFLTHWGYELVIARDGVEALRLLEAEDAPRLALLDWVMPGLQSVDICRAIRKAAARRYTYILLLTGKGQKADIIEGIEAGADDYLVKPFDAPELKVRLDSGRRVLDLQEKLLAATDALYEQATHDSLCGIWNRGAILDVLNRELARASRQQDTVCVLLADIDHFKHVNDSCGHAGGDAVLRETAQRMRHALRTYDAIGRYGGEEFLIVAPGLSFEWAGQLAERIRLAVARDPVPFGDASISVSLSLGVAVSGELSDAQRLLQAADAALYRAKAAGRNRVELAPHPPASPSASLADLPPRKEEAQDALIDTAAILSLVGGDTKLLGELVGIFLNNNTKELASLHDAVTRRDAAALEHAAHRLKGSICHFSAPAALRAASRIERISQSADLSAAPEAISALEAELRRLRPALMELTRGVQL